MLVKRRSVLHESKTRNEVEKETEGDYCIPREGVKEEHVWKLS